MRTHTILATLVCLAAGCSGSTATPAIEETPAVDNAPTYEKNGVEANAEDADVAKALPLVPEFAAKLKEAAAAYQGWSKIGNEPSWAPTLCMRPAPRAFPMLSESTSASTHGHKLYFLYSSHASDYLATPQTAQPVGQTLVKEAFAATPAGSEAEGGSAAERDGKRYVMGERRDLFIMVKLDPATPGTDQGWIYGTVTPKGRVTAAGRVDSCMRCHTGSETVDRMFGHDISGLHTELPNKTSGFSKPGAKGGR